MSDLPVEGTRAHPLRMGLGQRIVAVQFGGGIGVLTVDRPDGIRLSFDPPYGYMPGDKAVGDVISRQDFAKLDTSESRGLPAPISLLTTARPLVIATLYGEGDKHWAVVRVLLSPGADPGQHVRPSPFPPDMGLQANTFPNPQWSDYTRFYDDEKSKFLRKPNSRWVEVLDLKSLSDDVLITGDAQIYYGPGDSWQRLNYGLIENSYFHLIPYVPPRTNIFGVQQYDTVILGRGVFIPGNLGYAPQFEIFEPRKAAPFGLGQQEVNGNPGRKAIREIYFLDFEVIKDGVVTVRSEGQNPPDPLMPDGFTMAFRLRLFGGGTRFTLGALDVEPVAPATASYTQRKAFPYTQAGQLLQINRRGFV